MLVSHIWLALLGVAVMWELYCNLVDQRWVSLNRLGELIGRSLAGRLLLVAAWAFIGWHLFARYTLPS